MKVGLYVRLSVMMFLQYAIWGAWMPVLSSYLDGAGFTGLMIGIVYSLLPLGILLSPITGGQLADRYMPTQWLLVIANLAGAAILYLASTIDYAAQPWTIFGLMFAFSVFYGPTLPLTNTLSFRHLSNIEKDFGKIRVWGTIGWIAAGLVLMAWRQESEPGKAVVEAKTWIDSTWNTIWTPISHAIGLGMARVLGPTGPRDTLLLGAFFSVLMGLFCAALPHTPPKREGVEPLAFVKAFRLLKDHNFLVFMVISFIVTTELWFYYVLTGPFLQSAGVGIDPANVPGWMTTAQIGEIFTMVILLPILLPKLGVRLCLVLGVIAWPIRYAVFAVGYPWWLVVGSLPIHGFCYVFFFVVGQIYSDSIAPKDIRASVQSLWAVCVLGIGSIIGSTLAGWVRDLFTVDKVVNYRGVFLVPLVVTVLCALAFLVFFREPEKKQTSPGTAA